MMATKSSTTSAARLTQHVSDTAPQSAEEDAPFRLLDLPPEIVIRILDFAVTRSSAKDPLTLRQVRWCPLRKGSVTNIKDFFPHAITETCRFLRNEGVKLHYRNNFFAFTANPWLLERLKQWVRQLPKEHRALISNLLIGARSAQEKQDWNRFEADMHIITMYAEALDLYIRQENGKVVRHLDKPPFYYGVRFGSQQRNAKDQSEWFSISALVTGQIKKPVGEFWVLKDDM